MVKRKEWNCPYCGKPYLIPKDAAEPECCQNCVPRTLEEIRETTAPTPKRSRSSDTTILLSVLAGAVTAVVIVRFLLDLIERPQPPSAEQPVVERDVPRDEEKREPRILVSEPPPPAPPRHEPQPQENVVRSPPPIPSEEPRQLEPPIPPAMPQPPAATPKPAIAQKPTKEMEIDAHGVAEWHPKNVRVFRGRIIQYDLGSIHLKNRDGELYFAGKPIDEISPAEKGAILEVVRYYTRPGSRTPLAGRKDIQTLKDLRTYFPALYGSETTMPFHAVIFRVAGERENKVFPIYAFGGKELQYLWKHGHGVMRYSGSAAYKKTLSKVGVNRDFMEVDVLLVEE